MVEVTKLSADMRAAAYAAYVADFIENGYMGRGSTSGEITMTDATEAIWGSSGRGNPNAVRIVEAVATLGFLKIRSVGKRKRMVSRTSKPIPDEAFAYTGIAAPLP